MNGRVLLGTGERQPSCAFHNAPSICKLCESVLQKIGLVWTRLQQRHSFRARHVQIIDPEIGQELRRHRIASQKSWLQLYYTTSTRDLRKLGLAHLGAQLRNLTRLQARDDW